jgi:TldD protein
MHHAARNAIDIAIGLGASYADVRIIEQKRQMIQTKDLALAGLTLTESMGMGIRVLYQGGWGFASTQSLTASGISKAAKLAVAVAKASATCVNPPITLATEPRHRAKWQSPCLIDPFTISLEEKVGLLLDCAKIMRAVKGISLVQGEMTFTKENKVFVSSEGAEIEQTFVRSSCGIEANAFTADDRQRRSWPNSFGGQSENAGWEVVHKWQLQKNARRIAEEAVALLKAPMCPEGTTTVIIGGSQLALQIHESCGHPSELDRALGHEANFAGTSFLTKEMLGKLQYGSKIVNLVADATAVGALGGFAYDDEGVAAQCVPLVQDGLFVGYLSSRDTAHLIGLDRSGGATRAESYNYQPIIRMTNISLRPGQAGTLDDLIGDTDDGILMDTNKSWSIDDKRYNFQFGMEAGYKIERGKIVGLIKNPSYGGITTEFWNNCDAICSQSEYIDWGVPNCGKGQPMQTMWTGHGAAPARFRKIQFGMAR